MTLQPYSNFGNLHDKIHCKYGVKKNNVYAHKMHIAMVEQLNLLPPKLIREAPKSASVVLLVCAIGQARSPLFACLNFAACLFSIYFLECYKFARRYPDYFQRTGGVHLHDTRNKLELYDSVSGEIV
jgi:hypothetical protein